MVERRTAVLVRLNPEDREFVRRMAEYYDISEAGVLRMALREFLRKRKDETKVNHTDVVGTP